MTRRHAGECAVCPAPTPYLNRRAGGAAATGQQCQELQARYRRDSLDQIHAHLGQELKRGPHQGMELSSDEALDLASGKLFQPDYPA